MGKHCCGNQGFGSTAELKFRCMTCGRFSTFALYQNRSGNDGLTRSHGQTQLMTHRTKTCRCYCQASMPFPRSPGAAGNDVAPARYCSSRRSGCRVGCGFGVYDDTVMEVWTSVTKFTGSASEAAVFTPVGRFTEISRVMLSTRVLLGTHTYHWNH